MRVVPIKLADRIAFFQNHIAPLTTNAAQVGTTTSAVADLSAKTAATAAAMAAAQVAREAAQSKTLDLKVAAAAMDAAGAAIIKQVRAKAATAGDGVYALANLPAPATPSPTPAPGKPTDFAATMSESGSLELTWKCKNGRAGGTMYQVYRRSTPGGEFVYLGGAGEKRFVDATIPAGSSQVTYQVQGVRSTAVGPWAQFNVNFGSAGGGGGTTAAVGGATPKMAA